MRKIIFVFISIAPIFAIAQQQQPNWQTCQYEQNPQQCMQGVPTWQQTPQSMGPAKDPQSGLVRGNPNFQLGNGGVNCTTIKSGNQYQTQCK